MAAIIALLAGFLFLNFAIKPYVGSSISSCQNSSCVQKMASLWGFNPARCSQLTSLDSKNNCYFDYQAYNWQSEGKKYTTNCDNIKDVDLVIECYSIKYRKKIPFLKGSYVDSINWAINTQDMGLCDKISDQKLKQECINGVVVVKNAISQKKPAECYDVNFDISNFARKICSATAAAALKNKK